MTKYIFTEETAMLQALGLSPKAEFSAQQWQLVLIGMISSAHNSMFMGIDLSVHQEAARTLLIKKYPQLSKLFEHFYNL